MQSALDDDPVNRRKLSARKDDMSTDVNKVQSSSRQDSVSPLKMSAGRWIALSNIRKRRAVYIHPLMLMDCKVRALLNRLTLQNFDNISDRIIAWANKSKYERDGRTLILVIRLVYEQVTDEASWIEMFARLCRKMMENISPEVQDDGVKNAEGKPISGGELFRKYLLNRCQEDFERRWVVKETTATRGTRRETCNFPSNEHYAIQKAKYQNLGLIKFIGELFKLRMLTERITHECIQKLLGNIETPEEEQIESLCQLLKIAGQLLDVPKARKFMDIYFERMKTICKHPDVRPRAQFMLQDVIELRDRKWVTRGAIITLPTTISVHETVSKESAAAEVQTFQFSRLSISETRSIRDSDCESLDFSKAIPAVMGRNDFIKKDAQRSLPSRMHPSSRVTSAFQSDKLAADTIPKPGRPAARTLTNSARGGVQEPHHRNKLYFLPRTRPTPSEETFPPASPTKSAIQMSEADVKKKIDEDVDEFFTLRDVDKAIVYFANLPKEHHFRLVAKLVGFALQSKVADVTLVSKFFADLVSKDRCSPEAFEAGFVPTAESLDDFAVDVPNSFKFMTVMLRGAGLDKDEERMARIAGKSTDSDKLLQSVSL